MPGKWELKELRNSYPSEWKVVCEFHSPVVDGSVWSVSEDGQKVMLSGGGRWLQ